jgi:hypothetical protein
MGQFAGIHETRSSTLMLPREGDIVYVRMEVRKPFGEFGTIQRRISSGACTSHYVSVSPEHALGRVAPELSGSHAASAFEGQAE